MNTLNIVNKSPFEKRTLDQCLSRMGENDSVLLIEDATVAAVTGTAVATKLNETSATTSFYVLQPDLAARGFGEAKLLERFSTVDYAGFVELVTKHDRVHSWL